MKGYLIYINMDIETVAGLVVGFALGIFLTSKLMTYMKKKN